MLFQYVGNSGGHEVNNRLRRVDNAVRVGQPGGIALEELFVHGVKELLLVREIRQCTGGVLNRDVKAIETLEIIRG